MKGHAGTDKESTKAFIGSRPTGKDLYEQIGHLYSTLDYGTKHKKIAEAFGRTQEVRDSYDILVENHNTQLSKLLDEFEMKMITELINTK